jgi:transposase-like protein
VRVLVSAYPLSYRDLEEMMAGRGLIVDHSTIARRVLYYSAQSELAHGERCAHPTDLGGKMKLACAAGKWAYFIYCAIDSAGNNRSPPVAGQGSEYAKGFLRLALSAAQVRPLVINGDGHSVMHSARAELGG